jgi:hypothetical protein
MKNILFVAALLICGTVFSQKKYKDLKSEYNAQVECLGTGADQVQVLKVFSFKKKRKVKEEDYAKIKRGAIFTVIFNGIPGTKSTGCAYQPPLLKEDAYEQHSEYFDDFFRNGKFAQFISLSNQSSMDIVKMGKGYEMSMDVTVRRDALSRKLEEDGIRKGMSSAFD